MEKHYIDVNTLKKGLKEGVSQRRKKERLYTKRRVRRFYKNLKKKIIEGIEGYGHFKWMNMHGDDERKAIKLFFA